MIAERSKETVPHHLLHVFLLGSPQKAKTLKQRLQGDNFAVTHLTHLGGHTSAMIVRLMSPDVWLACCTHAREIQQIRQITPRAPMVVCSEVEEEGGSAHYA